MQLTGAVLNILIIDGLTLQSRLQASGREAELRVYIDKDTVSLLLDISGDPLFKRGYRLEGGIAPLRETTAAALLLLSGWKRKYPLYDPYCGSGTILAEALVYAWDMAPGLSRKFALNNLLIADSAKEDAVRAELRGKINFERLIRIAGSDEDDGSIKLAASNFQRALRIASGPNGGAFKLPELKTLPMIEAQPPFDGAEGDGPRGFIVTNPPYGKRLGDTAASEKNYREMKAMRHNFPGWKLAVICDHPGFESFFGKKADTCREIICGPVPAYFYQYERL